MIHIDTLCILAKKSVIEFKAIKNPECLKIYFDEDVIT